MPIENKSVLPTGAKSDEIKNKPEFNPQPGDAKPSDKGIDPGVLDQMLFGASNSNTKGNITLTEETKDMEKEAEEKSKRLVEVNSKSTSDRIGKYKEDLIANAKKNPAAFEVETPEGWMNLKEAIDRGWNPKTGEFDLEPIQNNREAILAGLSPEERAKIEQMTNPANLQLSDMQAQQYGISPDSSMMHNKGNTIPPAMPQGMPQGAMPQGQPVPEAAPQAGGVPDIAAMLGGGGA